MILDWGFWTKEAREDITNFFKSKNINVEWHYVDVDEETWHKNIEERNKRIKSGNDSSDFYIDEKLLNKNLSIFEKPTKDEIDVWHIPEKRETAS